MPILNEIAPVNEHCSTWDYYLTIGNPIHDAFKLESNEAMTWKELAEAATELAKEENICLSHIAEQGAIRHGMSGQPYFFPEDAKLLIVSDLLIPA